MVIAKLRRTIINNVSRWAKESFIEDSELIRGIFSLLLRQYNGVAEVLFTCLRLANEKLEYHIKIDYVWPGKNLRHS